MSLEENQPIQAEALNSSAFGTRNGLAYGLMGFPLAFAALPLYVILPNHYARAFGVPLATLGAVLLGARLFDAFIDPALGKLVDRLFMRSTGAVLVFGALAAVVLAFGFVLLFPARTVADCARCLGQRHVDDHLCRLQCFNGGAPSLGRFAGRQRNAAKPHRRLA